MKKIFVIENQPSGGWTNGTRSILGVILDRESRTLKIEQLKGIDLTFAGFIALMKNLRADLEEAMEGYERKRSFFVRMKEGSSGCRDYDLIVDRTLYEWMERQGREVEFLGIQQRHLLHLSCAGKCTFPREWFIPDLPLLLRELLSDIEDIDEMIEDIFIHSFCSWNRDDFDSPESACGFEVLDSRKEEDAEEESGDENEAEQEDEDERGEE